MAHCCGSCLRTYTRALRRCLCKRKQGFAKPGAAQRWRKCGLVRRAEQIGSKGDAKHCYNQGEGHCGAARVRRRQIRRHEGRHEAAVLNCGGNNGE